MIKMIIFVLNLMLILSDIQPIFAMYTQSEPLIFNNYIETSYSQNGKTLCIQTDGNVLVYTKNNGTYNECLKITNTHKYELLHNWLIVITSENKLLLHAKKNDLWEEIPKLIIDNIIQATLHKHEDKMLLIAITDYADGNKLLLYEYVQSAWKKDESLTLDNIHLYDVTIDSQTLCIAAMTHTEELPLYEKEQGVWSTSFSIPHANRDSFASLTRNGSIVYIEENFQYQNSLSLYEKIDGKWLAKETLLVPNVNDIHISPNSMFFFISNNHELIFYEKTNQSWQSNVILPGQSVIQYQASLDGKTLYIKADNNHFFICEKINDSWQLSKTLEVNGSSEFGASPNQELIIINLNNLLTVYKKHSLEWSILYQHPEEIKNISQLVIFDDASFIIRQNTESQRSVITTFTQKKPRKGSHSNFLQKRQGKKRIDKRAKRSKKN